ncbi:MAG: peptidyl-prolyl cis-trans isomerase [Pyrinomonadaceae bacterium]
MLKFFSRLEKTRNFFILIFAIIMVASLVLFYSPTRGGLAVSPARSEELVANVNGEKISLGELYRQRERYSQYTQGRAYPANLVLRGLIDSRVTRLEAQRLGLTASNAEVAAALREQLKNPDGTVVDQARYEQYAIDQAGSVPAYEQQLRDSLSGDKLRAFITSGVTVSEADVLNDFQRKNTKFDLTYVAVTGDELSKAITPTDAELHDYFEKNKASYYISEPQKKIKYLFVNTAKIGEKLPISDADLKAEYDKLPDDKKKAGVLGQEIVLRVPKPDFDSQVQEKANQIVQRLKKDGENVSEAAFAEIAKGQSENAASASQGGKLKGPVRENPNNPTDPYQRLIKMQPGEVSEPISYKGSYFILRRGEDVPKPFEDAKKELEVSLRNRRAYAVAAELAGKVAETLKQNKDAAKTAQQFAVQANTTPADMVKETAYIKTGDDVPNIGISPQFEDGIKPLENVGDVGDKIPVTNGFAIPILADKKEPRDADFEDVKAQLIDVVKLDKARGMTEETAKQIAAGASNAAGLSAAAFAKGLKAADQKAFILGSPLGQGTAASTSDELENAIYSMKPGETTKTPIKVGESWYIVGVTGRTDANMDDFAKQRDSLREQILMRKRGEIFADYLASARQKLEAAGDIKIYNDVVAKIEEPTQPGGPEGE